MRIRVYVKDAVSPEQTEWAKRLREKHHQVHMSLDEPFERVIPCDAYISDNPKIIEAHANIKDNYGNQAPPIPRFEESMLADDRTRRTHVEDVPNMARPQQQTPPPPTHNPSLAPESVNQGEPEKQPEPKKRRGRPPKGKNSAVDEIATHEIEKKVLQNTGGDGALPSEVKDTPVVANEPEVKKIDDAPKPESTPEPVTPIKSNTLSLKPKAPSDPEPDAAA